MTRTILPALSAVLLSSPFAASAAAPGTPAETVGVVAVADGPAGPSAELAELARTFRTSLSATSPGVLSADEVRLRMEGRSSSASLTELDRAYTGAVAAFQAGDYERASRTLRAVIEDLERLPPSDQVFAQWSRAMMRLARTEGSLGRKGEAKEVMERILRADPAASPDPELYPPSFARQVDEVRTELRAKPRKKLVVNAGGAAARVYVEGRFAGDAPVTLSVVPGKYRVSGVLRDVTSSPLLVEIAADDQTVSLDFGVAETLRPGAGPGLATPAVPARRATAIVSAGAFLKLDRIFGVSLASDGDVKYVVGSVYDVAKGSLQREGRVRLAGGATAQQSLDALASFLQTGEASSLVITKPEPEKKPKPMAIAPEEPGTGKRPNAALKWSPVVTAVLAVGLGAYAVMQNSEAEASYEEAKGLLLPGGSLGLESNRSRYDGLVSDGDSAKSTARIAGIGSGVALVSTGILSYVAYKKTGEVGPFRF